VKRLVAKFLLEFAAKIVDDTVPVERLHAHLQRMDQVAQANRNDDAVVQAYLLTRSGRNAWSSDDLAWEGKIIEGGRVATGVVERLANSPSSPAASRAAERLMRFVEVKRADARQQFGLPGDADSTWWDYLWTAILLSRLTLVSHDIRFVNTALKMNDWAFRSLASREGESVGMLFALSLAEQERAFGEVSRL